MSQEVGEQPPAQGQYPFRDEEEISLRDLWQILVCRKRTVLLSTGLCLVLAGLYLALTVTIYQSTAMIRLGQVAGAPVDNGTQVAIHLKNKYTPVNTLQAKTLLPRLHGVTSSGQDASILTLIAYGRSPSEAQQYLASVTKNFLSQQNRRYGQSVTLLQNQLAQLQTTYNRLQAPTKPNPQAKTPLASNAISLFLQQSERDSTLTTLLGSIYNLQNQLAPAKTYPTIETLSPRYDPTPVAPKKLLVLVLALIGGILLGVFLALMGNAFSESPSSKP